MVDCSNIAAAALTFEGVPFAAGVDVEADGEGFSGDSVAIAFDLEGDGDVEVEGPVLGDIGKS